MDLSGLGRAHPTPLVEGDLVRLISAEVLATPTTIFELGLRKGTWTAPEGDCFFAMILGQAPVVALMDDQALAQAAVIQLTRMGWLAAEELGDILKYLGELQALLVQAQIKLPEPPDCLKSAPVPDQSNVIDLAQRMGNSEN